MKNVVIIEVVKVFHSFIHDCYLLERRGLPPRSIHLLEKEVIDKLTELFGREI